MSYQKNNPRQLHQPINNIHSTYSIKSRIQIEFPTEGRTKQSFKDECDINRIMARYQSTGQLPNMAELAPQYLDVTGLDYQEHQNFIAGANTLFNELPSSIRARFANSPAEFLDFCSQEKNRPEMAEMGLLRPKPAAPVPEPPPAAPNVSDVVKTNDV